MGYMYVELRFIALSEKLNEPSLRVAQQRGKWKISQCCKYNMQDQAFMDRDDP